MSERPGLREAKKRQTQHALWHAAVGLFGERGFDGVSVSEIAAAANVSRTTVFNYFRDKEDLVLAPMAADAGRLALIVRERTAGESALAALRRQFLAALAGRDAAVGLNDDPVVLSVQRLVRATPSLQQRAYGLAYRSQELLAAELAGESGAPDATARAAAALLAGVRNTLIAENISRLLGGEPAGSAYPAAVADAETAFGLLENGLGPYCTRR